jgi:co-chaperonin GroES (HSP10)
MRSHSLRVTVGDAAAAQKPATEATMIDGEPVVIMEAEETVQD